MADELIRLDTTIIGIDNLINKASTAEEDEQQLRDEVKRMEQARRDHKRGVRVTAREQTDAGYALEALKKYQDKINAR